MHQNNLCELRSLLSNVLVRNWELAEREASVKTEYGVVIADCPHVLYAKYIHGVRPTVLEDLVGEIEELRKLVRGKKRRIPTAWYIVTKTVENRHYYGGADPDDPSWMLLTTDSERALCFAIKAAAVREMKARKLDDLGYIAVELPIPDKCL